MGICQGCQCTKGLFDENLIESKDSINEHPIKEEFFSNDNDQEQETKGGPKAKKSNLKRNELRDKVQATISSIGRYSTAEEFNRIVPEKYLKYSIENPIEWYLGDDDSTVIPLVPIRLQNGNYYWGNWNEDGEMAGSGKLYLVNEIVYVEGLWKKGQIYKGRILMPDDAVYEGEISDSQYNGKGKLLYCDGKKYEGTFSNGNKDGKGTLTFPDGSKYTGNFSNDLFDGEGTFKWSDGYEYEGEFKANDLNGKGVLKNSKGSSYNGEFRNNMFQGKGVYKWSTGEKYDGQYGYGMKKGKGEYSARDNTNFTGGWLNGTPHGPLTIETRKDEYVSYWRNGQMIEISNLGQNSDSTNFDVDVSPLKEDIDPSKLPYLRLYNTQVVNTDRSFEPTEVVIVDGFV